MKYGLIRSHLSNNFCWHDAFEIRSESHVEVSKLDQHEDVPSIVNCHFDSYLIFLE